MDVLQNAVAAALCLPPEEQELALPAAVQTVLESSENRAEGARMLIQALEIARPRLPKDTTQLLDRLHLELQAELRAAENLPQLGNEVQGKQQTKISQCSQTGDDDQSDIDTNHAADDENEGKPFCLGQVNLPLATMLKITNCLEPDDLSPAAQACKSLCIPININLQYILFLVRLLRLIVLGPEAARALREQEDSSGDDTDSTLPSSND